MNPRTRIICDSVGPTGIRLTTFEVTLHRFVLAEMNTHRAFSRNAASSRAIPVGKMIQRVLDDPAVPIYWGKNQTGMQAGREIEDRDGALRTWLAARDQAVQHAEYLLGLGVHKQIANRLLEPFSWTTCLISATEWDNFFHLRCHEDAQPEMKWVADAMYEQYRLNSPTRLRCGEWHLPLIYPSDYRGVDLDTLKKVSVGRCARVSYLTHDGKRDLTADVALHDRLAGSGHWSPFEHVASALSKPNWHGNFRGWYQLRKLYAG